MVIMITNEENSIRLTINTLIFQCTLMKPSINLVNVKYSFTKTHLTDIYWVSFVTLGCSFSSVGVIDWAES